MAKNEEATELAAQTDDQNDVTGLRFTEVELSENDYIGKDGGYISEVGVHHDDELYQMKHC